MELAATETTSPCHRRQPSQFKCHRPDLGVNHPDLGVNHPDLGVNRPDLGVNHPDLGKTSSALHADILPLPLCFDPLLKSTGLATVFIAWLK